MKNKNFQDLPDYLTVLEAADVLRIGRTKAYQLSRSGGIPVCRIGRQVRVPKEALIASLNTH